MILNNELPQYEIKLPSNGKTILVRPFVVKEEKLLLMAVESKDDNEIINVTKQIIKNCILSEGIDVEKLPFFDIDYIFIALRAKSVGESIEIKFTCKNFVEEKNDFCNSTFPATIDISNCKIVNEKDVQKNIQLAEKVTFIMKYPTYTTMKMITSSDNILNKKIKMIVECIDMIKDGDNLYTNKDFTKDELTAYVENLTQGQFTMLEEWVDNFPSFVVTSQATCSKCGFVHNLEYKDFSSFFV